MNPFRVITARDAEILNKKEDTYFAKIIKYIPAEIVAGYTALRGIYLTESTDPIVLLINDENKGGFALIFYGCLILTPLYKYYALKDPKLPTAWFQIIISTLAFAVWVFALGDYFKLIFDYDPKTGSVILIFFTLIIPLLEKINESISRKRK